jgi:two-component system sensor histidine kinase RpfC
VATISEGREAAAPAAAEAATSATAGAVGGWLGRLRRRLRERPDTEHEQAVTRLIVVPGMFAYMLWVPLPPAEADAARFASFLIFAAGSAAAVAVILHILRHPGVNRARRALSLVADVAGVTAGMLVGGTTASVFFPLLLWIILGYGFRYGRPYLIAAAVLSVAAFSLVLALSPDWRRTPFISVALILALVILPAYFAVLLAKLTDAVRRAEEERRAKSHFLAAKSHEFRTPLNAVIGMGEALATTRLDADQRDMIATVRAAAIGLLGLVDDVLDLARLEARRFTVDDAVFDLHELLATVRHLVFHAANAKGLHLRLRLAPDTPYRLRGGPRALRQVLLNLVGNAVRFTEAGGVTIGVRPVAWPEGGEPVGGTSRLRFEVSDTGLGLSPEAQGRVFERFTQAEETRRKVVGGTGLGLSIARELVELMGGRIGGRECPGRRILLLARAPDRRRRPRRRRPRPAPAASEDAAAETGRGEVLVLGGDEEVAAALERLARAGFRGRSVASVEAALGLVARHERPAVLLVTARQPPGGPARARRRPHGPGRAGARRHRDLGRRRRRRRRAAGRDPGRLAGGRP